MWRARYQLLINSPPSVVWETLTDFASYPTWNRYATFAQGELRVGGEVEIVVHLGSSTQRVNNRVLEIIPNQRLCWRSLSWYQAVVYGVRCRILEPQPDNTTLFSEEEVMYGPVAGLVTRFLGTQMQAGLRAECESLKSEAERRASL